MAARWQFWIDRGGTFTDCIGVPPGGGAPRVAKLLSSDRAPLDGIRRLLGIEPGGTIPPCDVRMGTTLATNALLERKGTPTGLVISRGFGDLLEIGDQSRPHIFDLRVARPEVLYREVLELSARCDAGGRVLERPDPTEARHGLCAMRERGIESVAVVFLHAYRAGELEREVGALARELGFRHVSLSHEVAAELGMLGRGDTTVVDAYLTPLIRDYVATLRAELSGSALHIMQSSGGLTDAAGFRGHNAILSGPAGGVVACARIAADQRLREVIGFDMGGTSTDVARVAGELDRVYESRVAGVRLRAPMMRIHTVAAGGGSICRYEGGRFTVGPDSAGAVPGPLCYGHADARELTLTDVNLALGRLPAERFPFPLERAPVERALADIAARLGTDGDAREPRAIAAGFFEVAVEHMAEAIRRITVARGHDARDHSLIVFGGAGGQHACAVARRLGIRRMVFHPLGGVLSGYGMGVADVRWNGQHDAGRFLLADVLPDGARAMLAELEAGGREAMSRDGFAAAAPRAIARADLRYVGTEAALTLAVDDAASLRERFEAAHRQRFGYARAGHPVEVVTLRMELVAPSADAAAPVAGPAAGPGAQAEPAGQTRMWLDGEERAVPVHPREALREGQRLAGPAVVLEDIGTIVVDPGFELTVAHDGVLLVEDVAGGVHESRGHTQVDPVRLEVFNHLFMSIAEEMGVVLQRTALSTNIRERLDFSCALFRPDGALIANAPHIPVHLGAMGESVKAVLAAHPDLAPGDVFVTNDPHCGGSHLPDVTVVSPVFDGGGRVVFITASRGHHADIGGVTPGSMPPFSTSLEEEGVVLSAVRAVRGGVLAEDALRRLLTGARYPARDPDQNLRDLEAQIAANRRGEALLGMLIERYGLATVEAYTGHVQDNAEARVREAIAALPDGEHAFEDRMDDGTAVAVRLRVEGDRMHVDFAGTGPRSPGNLNAPRAVTVAAVLYVLRSLVGAPIPLNAGCLRPITLVIPEGCLLDPAPGAAVVAGNVETSQRVVDVLLGALGKLAACQGTMNNLTFGDARFGYYETIAGGAGAGPDHDGVSGVHTHMTNTRITDPEVLEARFPVRLVRFALRRGSGGAGRFRGGDGVVRELEALAPLSVSILSERRDSRPFGLDGGEAGAAGRNFHGSRTLPGRVAFEVAAGERFGVETPGGGGFGRV